MGECYQSCLWKSSFAAAERLNGRTAHHVVLAEEEAEGLHDFADLAGLGDEFLAGALAFLVPVPGVLEGLNPAGSALRGNVDFLTF